MNVGKWCSRYVNGGHMNMRLNGEPLEEVDYFKYFMYLKQQHAADGG